LLPLFVAAVFVAVVVAVAVFAAVAVFVVVVAAVVVVLLLRLVLVLVVVAVFATLVGWLLSDCKVRSLILPCFLLFCVLSFYLSLYLCMLCVCVLNGHCEMTK